MFLSRLCLKKTLILALAASLLSLGVAYIAQYGLGLKPCELCILQRIPYGVVIALALLGLWKPASRILLLALIGLAFFTGGGIASYHAAVEKQWVKGPTSCTDTGAKALETIDDFLHKMQQAPIVACDQPQWEFHGITMAGINAVWSLLLAAFIFCALQQFGRKGEPHA